MDSAFSLVNFYTNPARVQLNVQTDGETQAPPPLPKNTDSRREQTLYTRGGGVNLIIYRDAERLHPCNFPNQRFLLKQTT